MIMADRYLGERTFYSYAYKTLQESGALVAFRSDAPVESPNPFWGLHAATTRCRLDGYPGNNGWHPEQRISLEYALEGYTTGASFAAGRETDLGKIAPGYRADMILLPIDPIATSLDNLRTIEPFATMVGGTWVWKSANSQLD